MDGENTVRKKEKFKKKSEKERVKVVPYRVCAMPAVPGESLKILYHPVVLWLATCTYKYRSLWTLSFIVTSCSEEN